MSQPSGCEGTDRSALRIAWSCVAVIFACAWKAVHPDVPPKHLRGSKWKLARRRLYMTLWTILVPELVVMRAAYQYFQARRVSEVYKEQHMEDIELNTGALPRYRKCVKYHFASGLMFNASQIRRLYSESVSIVVPKTSASPQQLPFVPA